MDEIKYEIVNVNWCKRRTYVESPIVDTIKLENFKLAHNHFCTMIVTYQNGTEVKLIGRVLYNDLTIMWYINGINHHGDNVTIRLIQ